ncbi:MAG: guanylate kinase [Dehalococcoidia bacterium]|nr:guanylate kinase [Dehalococcoidia bacterium]
MSDGPPLLVVISGPSGVGKDAVLERMRRTHDGWHFVVTATTRPKRPGERDGVDYIFLEPSQFQALLERDGFLEHAQVYGRYYGVPRGQVEEALHSGKDVVVKTDVQGARTIRAKQPNTLLVFLAPPDMQELERRLRQRKSETPEELQRRIQTAQHEMTCQGEFDHVVVNRNGRIDEAVAEIERIISSIKHERRSGTAP